MGERLQKDIVAPQDPAPSREAFAVAVQNVVCGRMEINPSAQLGCGSQGGLFPVVRVVVISYDGSSQCCRQERIHRALPDLGKFLRVSGHLIHSIIVATDSMVPEWMGGASNTYMIAGSCNNAESVDAHLFGFVREVFIGWHSVPPMKTRVGQPRKWRPSFGAVHQNPWRVALATLQCHQTRDATSLHSATDAFVKTHLDLEREFRTGSMSEPN